MYQADTGTMPHNVTWSDARSATLHCLTGCAIGEVAGMIIATVTSIGNLASVLLATGLAFVFGYALTMRGLLRGGNRVGVALRIALAADTLSILTMEIVDNGVVAIIPGALNAQLNDVLFWVSLALSLLVAFFAAWPVNRWLMSRGQGHAHVHQMHHH